MLGQPGSASPPLMNTKENAAKMKVCQGVKRSDNYFNSMQTSSSPVNYRLGMTQAGSERFNPRASQSLNNTVRQQAGNSSYRWN